MMNDELILLTHRSAFILHPYKYYPSIVLSVPHTGDEHTYKLEDS
jgi:hypothetical protein